MLAGGQRLRPDAARRKPIFEERGDDPVERQLLGAGERPIVVGLNRINPNRRLLGQLEKKGGRCVGQAPVHGLSEHGIVAVADRKQEELSSQPRREFIDLHRVIGGMKFSLEQLFRLARRNSTKAMALQASVKRGTGKVRNRLFETTQAIVYCKPHASAVYNDQRLGRQIEDSRLTLLWPFACVFRRARAFPPGDGLGVHAKPCG